MKQFITLLLILFALGCKQNNQSQKGTDLDNKVETVLAKMNLKEKIGQMTQVTLDVVSRDSSGKVVDPHQIDTAKLNKAILDYQVGSILNVPTHAFTREHWLEIMTAIQNTSNKTRLKIPVIYGIDAIHGVTYTVGSTLFPQQIAVAATWNTQLAKQAAAVTAYETRASYIPWDFSPLADLGRNQAWPRIYETFGEDVFIAKSFTKAVVEGYQGDDMSDKYKMAACLKHYVGYSFPLSGKDRTPAWIPERFLQEYFLPSFASGVNTGAATIMVNSSEINGIPVHADYHILTEILRNQLGFKGIAVSDWEDIKSLQTRHHVAKTQKDAVKMSVMAGIDMSMVPFDFTFADTLLALVNEGKVPEWRINEAVRRILRVKIQLGLFDTLFYKKEDYPKFGSDEFRQINLQAATECITLLKNQANVLPLPKSAKVLVTGFSANSMRCLNGGWSYTWQGERTDEFAKDKNTILRAIKAKIGDEKVVYDEGVTYDAEVNMEKTIADAKNADYIVLCLGENSYTETPGNIADLYLPYIQGEFARQLAKVGKPIILVLTEGRPRLISKFDKEMNAILMAYLPGNEGGNAIADIIFGDANPSGKLPFTYPQHPNALENYDAKYSDFMMGYSQPQFPFGFGLSYTKFEYSDLKVNKNDFALKDSIEISVKVANKGSRDGKEVVQLYISDLYASITPPVKRLRGFEKINIKAGEAQTVSFKISTDDLAFVAQNNRWITEPGDFIISIEKLTQKFVVK